MWAQCQQESKTLKIKTHQRRTHVLIENNKIADTDLTLSNLFLIQSSFPCLLVPCNYNCNIKKFNSLTTHTHAMISQIIMFSLFFFLFSSFLIVFFFHKISALHILKQWFLSFENRLHLHQSFKIPRYNLHSLDNSLYQKILTYLRTG